MTTLLLATRNPHKVEEIRALLGGHAATLTLRDFPNAPEVVEDAATFAGNATKKAVRLAEWLASDPEARAGWAGRGIEPGNLWVMADDSGLEVDALEGAPGVHSARFAAVDLKVTGNAPDAANNAKLLRLLGNVPEARRTARFRCVIALTPVLEPGLAAAETTARARKIEPQTRIFEGVCEGRILTSPRGSVGFGYDPLFVPEGYSESFGELGEAAKNLVSHRARALTRMRQASVQLFCGTARTD